MGKKYLDNLEKFVLDTMKGHVYEDYKQVVVLRSSKVFIEVEAVDGYTVVKFRVATKKYYEAYISSFFNHCFVYLLN